MNAEERAYVVSQLRAAGWTEEAALERVDRGTQAEKDRLGVPSAGAFLFDQLRAAGWTAERALARARLCTPPAAPVSEPVTEPVPEPVAESGALARPRSRRERHQVRLADLGGLLAGLDNLRSEDFEANATEALDAACVLLGQDTVHGMIRSFLGRGSR